MCKPPSLSTSQSSIDHVKMPEIYYFERLLGGSGTENSSVEAGSEEVPEFVTLNGLGFYCMKLLMHVPSGIVESGQETAPKKVALTFDPHLLIELEKLSHERMKRKVHPFSITTIPSSF
ncbi:hypothetical protein POM88_036434 [Heracleum sosnowskyi]|uniref:Uncharacterized protein n=1 Tax=Heracleum sosnowskyi TaxID=360622 RepID=A0AAD8HN58_9APIA|nr:hypothetical protein POM88_036434 [Heracleum sosnowskyi]